VALKDLVQFGKKDVAVRRDSDNPFALFRKEFDDLFDSFLRSFDVQPFEGKLGAFTPKLNVIENEKEISIHAELPGMDEKDIDVSLSKNSLIIKGEKREEKEDKGSNCYLMERSYGSFSRIIPLPVEVDEFNIKASFKKGMLSIVLPKTAKAVDEIKKIAVKVE